MSQIKVTVIADSVSSVTGKRITTLEAEFPRIILAEFNTHNAISKNASSSRAIPVPKMLEQVRNNPAMPVRFGAANKGMQDAGEHDEEIVMPDCCHGPYPASPRAAWVDAAFIVSDIAERYHNAGYAKQICNRLIEPFQMMKVVMTATEWNNFDWLRNHNAADPTIEALAIAIKEARDNSMPVTLDPGEWHTPYYKRGYWKPVNELAVSLSDFTPSGVFVDSYGNTLQDALDISASCCAQVSFRSLDDTMEKARNVVAKLNLKGEEPDQPVHASPLEHQASPINDSVVMFEYSHNGGDAEVGRFKMQPAVNIPSNVKSWQDGITHMDRDGQFGSGNLKGWIQNRQLVPNHVKRG